ncbi:CCR4-NOT transcription complex subunit 9-like [Dendrobium catenatum]|uniref:CCR4-NOT transcription complex subunit 9-like n=1 Tax=Dendrobium catenatum TaxID=906689 RepID=UPI0010A01020|nr:CCR4-NOT transcription complex subunit 9-like [Dendrobium catenatum]
MANVRSPPLVSALTRTRRASRSSSSACRVRGRTSEQVSTFILQKIILDEVGLYYICSTPDRFHCVNQVLGTMVESLVEQPSIRLLRHIIRCYLRFSEDRRYQACIALREKLPVRLKDGTFENLIRNDPITVHWFQRLLINLYGDVSVGGPKGGFGQ